MKASSGSPTPTSIGCSTCWSTSATRPSRPSPPGSNEPSSTPVLERIRRNQYKRMQPPIAKFSNRTVGYDFLYLRDGGT